MEDLEVGYAEQNSAADFRGPPILAYSTQQSPDPRKHTSLHNRFGVLKCSKTHLKQTRI